MKNNIKKIAWICHFGNEMVAKNIGSSKIMNFAPWISELIKLFENDQKHQIYIIAPNYYNNRNIQFVNNNINFHFFRTNRSIKPHFLRNFSWGFTESKKNIIKIIHKINPDIIHLHGSENPIYASAVLHLIDNYPVIVQIQGFVKNSSSYYNPIREIIRLNAIRIEKKINSKAEYFIVSSKNDSDYLTSINSSARTYISYYPINEPSAIDILQHEKKYDIVYYGRISRDKGAEDLISAIIIIKNFMPHIKVLIIGDGINNYTNFIKRRIVEHKLVENIEWRGFYSNQNELFQHVAMAKVFVLPTHFDGIPGTIRESFMLRLPVVSYNVGGIPSLNDEIECVALVEKGNIPELAHKIIRVLSDNNYFNCLVNNASIVSKNKFEKGDIYESLIKIYNSVIIQDTPPRTPNY